MLQDFLNAKPLYYDKIDYSRMPRVYESLKKSLKTPKIIHLIGTNGKGTTGRFLASALHSLGYSTGHYTSPHIIDFNERVWIDSQNITDEELEKSHEYLLTLLHADDADSLSYFEYTTLLAMVAFEELDYVVLEAGLGGENDATAVFDKILTLVTPIDIDHEAFLGNSVKEIATTKLNAVQNRAVLATQAHEEVYDIAESLAVKESLDIYKVETLLKKEDYKKIEKISQELSLVAYLQENLKLSVSALKILGLEYEAENFKESRLFGRLTAFRENIILDVGHNVLAASAIHNALKGEKYILIYNSYKDKNYSEILSILKPIVKSVEIIEIDDERIESRDILEKTIDALEIKHKIFKKIDKNKKYLLFGSFKVIEEFLKVYDD